MKFSYSLKALHSELEKLWALGEGIPSDVFEGSRIYQRILEVKGAIRLLEGHDFEVKGK